MRARVMATRGIAAAIGALTGVAAGISFADGNWAGGVASLVLPAVIAALLARWGLQQHLVWIALLAFSLRGASAVVLHAGSLAINRLGFVTGDDVGYARLAWAFVRYLQGDPIPSQVPPYWASDAYLFGTWVYLESAIFWLFGPNVVLAEIANALLSVGMVLAAADLARRLFDQRAGAVAAALVAIWPSLILWSSLTLKDTLAGLLIVTTLWCFARFNSRPGTGWLVGAFVSIGLMESTRWYVYLGLLLLAPIAVAVTRQLPMARRLRLVVVVAGVSLVLSAGSLAGRALGPDILATLEGTRRSMSSGARTAIEQPSPAPRLVAGDSFLVGDVLPADRPTPAPGPAAEPSGSRVVRVPDSARLVLVQSSATLPPPDLGVVYVRPGDRVIVTASTRQEEATQTVRSLAYLPIGYAFVLFAPFPWMASRAVDLLTIPEMLLWWMVLGGALGTIWRWRRALWTLAPLGLFILGMLTLLALAEGNVGTLFRHRGMIIPAMIILAAPTLVVCVRRIGVVAADEH